MLQPWYFYISSRHFLVCPWYFAIFLPKFYNQCFFLIKSVSMWLTHTFFHNSQAITPDIFTLPKDILRWAKMFYYFPALLFDQLLLLNQEFCVLSTWYFNLSSRHSEVHPWYFTIFQRKFFGPDLLVNQKRSMWFTHDILAIPCEILKCTHDILAFSAWLLVQMFLVTQCSSMCFTFWYC